MNILEELWYGNLSPSEQDSDWTGECKELLQLREHNRGNLEATLNEEEKANLEKMIACEEELQLYIERNAFVTGFRLAVQLMVASLG